MRGEFPEAFDGFDGELRSPTRGGLFSFRVKYKKPVGDETRRAVLKRFEDMKTSGMLGLKLREESGETDLHTHLQITNETGGVRFYFNPPVLVAAKLRSRLPQATGKTSADS